MTTAAAAEPNASARILNGSNVSDTAVQFLDPALNYDFIGWRLEFATCARLLSYPDKPGAAASRLVPEAATGFPTVSRDGTRYTFTVRSNFRFSDGSQVTAASFARSVERALSPQQQSPAASFIGDLVGADRVLAGKARRPSGLRVSGNKLTFVLTEARPDFPVAARDAVLLRGAGRPPHRLQGRQRASRRGAVLRGAASTRIARRSFAAIRSTVATGHSGGGRDAGAVQRGHANAASFPAGPAGKGRPRPRRPSPCGRTPS